MSAPSATVLVERPSTGARIFGLGSVFGKSLRDSRRAVLGVGLFVGFVAFLIGLTLAMQFPTATDRQLLAAQMAALPPLFRGLIGEPIRVETIPGFISWRSLNFMPIFVGIWSAIALSGTIAGEAGKGSLEVLAATPVRRWRIAAAKTGAHVVGLAVAMAIGAVLLVATTFVLGTLPGDRADLAAALAEFTWIGVGALFAGAVAFAVGPFVGRATAASLGVIVLTAGYVVNGFAASVPFFKGIEFLSIFDWTQHHRPLAGVYDWMPVVAVGLVDVVLLAAGVALFVRRDLAGVAIEWPSPAGGSWSVGGAIRRSLAERLPDAISFGLGVGAFGFFVSSSADEFARLLAELPQFADLVALVFPGVDLTTAAGVLELLFVTFASLLTGLAAAALAHGWGADERDGRLEMVLAVPVSRVRWAIATGVGTLLAVGVMTLVIAVLIGAGTVARGENAGGPVGGVVVLGLYAAGLAGAGVAVSGLVSPRLGGIVVGAYVIGAFLLEGVGTPLHLPDEILDLSLARHLGQPMIGVYDPVGLAIFATLAIGGLLLSAIGFRRRDVAA
jgi:ABC-2 type transport system permease protein